MLCYSTFKDKVERSMPAGSSAKVAAFDAADPIWTTGDTQRLNVNIRPQDGAYVIYTYVTAGITLSSRMGINLSPQIWHDRKAKGRGLQPHEPLQYFAQRARQARHHGRH